MSNDLITIRVKNTGQTLSVASGSTLESIYAATGLSLPHGPISARVNNKVEGMHYRAYKPKDVEFLDITSSSGLRAYTRSLFFLLSKATHDLYRPCRVSIDIPVSNGYYVNIDIGRPVTDDDVEAIRSRMQALIDADLI